MESVEVASEASTSPAKAPSPPPEGNGKDDPNRKKPSVRKRTKTGCLTCRRRRIKCDEGRPTCNNCMKSKRNCEGYNQRVVFKDPIGSFHGGPFGSAGFPADSSHLVNQLVSSQSKSSQSPLPIIAPKPPSLDFQGQSSARHGHMYHGQQLSSPSAPFNFNQPFVSPPMPPASSSASPQAPPSDPISGFSPLQPEQGGARFGHDSRFTGLDHGPTPQPQVSPGFEESPQPIVAPTNTEWDPWSDDDDEMADSEVEPWEMGGGDGNFGALVETHADGPPEAGGTQMRTFSAFAEGNALATYMPSHINSPLNDEKTAGVFWHFVHVTGPSMSLYERHPFDDSYMQSDQPLPPRPGQNIWTHTFPIVAFQQPALLQAMLALGSLQIAKLQRVPATAAMKHYHLALRRVAKNVRSVVRRSQPATLAATLLLAYFEVWSSDHSKWCQHLFGARILFREVPFRHMTRLMFPFKRKLRQQLAQLRMEQALGNPFVARDVAPPPDLDELDVDFVSQILGRPADPGDYGQDLGIKTEGHGSGCGVTELDVENYERLRDLFWWYAKMDVYQSILGGTRLFMDFEHWSQCPPRAPIGRLRAIYGTFDHLLLLLGRTANFTSRDLPRKRKVSELGPASASPPMFPGMLPTNPRVTVPMGFSPPRDPSPQSDNTDIPDLDESTQAALREWTSIRQAFETLRSRFGPELEPLGAEYADRRDSPFGPTVQYRTFSAAGIWMNYYMGLIHLYRAHPSMPPAALMAAGRAAQDTAVYAREIGRIAAGLADDCSGVTEISTLVGAAFIESCFCLFVAGVQYRDNAQRHWLVRRMHDIARLTGWGSAGQIADGLESGWTKAASMGRGPPYQRPPELAKSASHPAGENPRRIDRRIQELDDSEKRLVLARSERPYYALGLLSVDQDLERLELKDDG